MNLDNRSCFFDMGCDSVYLVACLLLPKLLIEPHGTLHLEYRHGTFPQWKFCLKKFDAYKLILHKMTLICMRIS